MQNLIIKSVVTLVFALIFTALAPFAFADSKYAGSSATLASKYSLSQKDDRIIALKRYLEMYNSPLADYAEDFVASADRYNLDWRLVAAISGLESGFGIHIPYNSYNGWGWGIYGNNVLRFNSWSEAIETISRGLRLNYLGDIAESNPYMIGPTYAASPTWAQRVDFFMQRIGEFKVANEKDVLSLSI